MEIKLRNGRVVGVVRGDVFHKSVSGRRHFLRRPAAIAFDVDTLRQAVDAGARRVRVVDTDNGDVYEADIDEVWAHGWAFNRGWGDQVALHKRRWTRNGRRPNQAHPVTQQLQMALFE